MGTIWDCIPSILYSSKLVASMHELFLVIYTFYRNPGKGSVNASYEETSTEMEKDIKQQFRLPDESEGLIFLILMCLVCQSLSIFLDSDNEIKSAIIKWIKAKVENRDLNDTEANEALNLVTILNEQLKLTRQEHVVSHSIGSIKLNM